jgi:hypothetical protein
LKIATGLTSIFALGAALLAGCAADSSTPKSASAEEKEMVTGSNIPRKDRSALGTKTISKEELSQAQGASGTGAGNPSGK